MLKKNEDWFNGMVAMCLSKLEHLQKSNGVLLVTSPILEHMVIILTRYVSISKTCRVLIKLNISVHIT